MTPDKIMSMAPGPELDKHLTEMLIHISGEHHYVRPFSSDPLTALDLWQAAADAFGSVALVKSSNGPILIGDFCTIRDDDDECKVVEVMTANWIESLAKAALLFTHGHYGDHMHPDFQRIINEAAPSGNLH
ncbi:hypothetical protein [Paenibacillus gansuensis]|uniref:Uncharacterized protein n=1 Tax=Paenibacillus gansuensis TaxID=306542 RepID=A0ABW5PHJ0_9BACL